MLMMTESFFVLEESVSMFSESAFVLEESYFSMGTNVFSRESWTKEFASVAKSSVVYNSLLLQAQSRANKIQQIAYNFFTIYS